MVLNLTPYQQDIFKEIGNVGIGNGATALGQMINRDVSITFPNVKLIELDTLFSIPGEFCVSNCALEGDLNGCITSIFDKKNSFNLMEVMLGLPKNSLVEVSDDSKGAYNEMLNVVGGCYLNALADMLGIRLMPKPPVFMVGNLPSIKDTMLWQFKDVKDSFFVQTDFTVDGEKIFGNIFLTLTPESNEKVLRIIEKMQCG
jgi:chemotaxis protein CheC